VIVGRPPRVQNFATLTAMEIHNSFEKQDSIHRDTICSGLSLETSPSLENSMTSSSKCVAMCHRGRRAEVTNFSTQKRLSLSTRSKREKCQISTSFMHTCQPSGRKKGVGKDSINSIRINYFSIIAVC
jgi:hypothetical protein